MTTDTRRFSDAAYALLRVFAGLLFACHGAQKLLGAFGGAVHSNPLLLAAGVLELFCGVLIAAGLLARPAAFLASGEMAFAYFDVHAPKGFWPIVNGGETALLYAFVFLFIAACGAGVYSLDAAIQRARLSPADGHDLGPVTTEAPRV
jgi:putative oxidoreductase